MICRIWLILLAIDAIFLAFGGIGLLIDLEKTIKLYAKAIIFFVLMWLLALINYIFDIVPVTI